MEAAQNMHMSNFLIEIERVKWFYKLDDDSFKQLKRYGNKTWICFNKYDSYNLELEYRKSKSNHLKPELVQVLDGLYEVNLTHRECYPIYWKAKLMPVMRSLWYNDTGEPLEENTSDEIEQKHIELFRDVILAQEENQIEEEATYTDEVLKPNKTPLATLDLIEGTVIWYSKDEIFIQKSKTNLIEIMHSKLSKLKHKIKINRIRRCIKHAEDVPDENYQNMKLKEVTHLVFVVHGVAQKLQKNKIIECCDAIRQKCEKKKQEFFPQCNDERFMFLPVDWRNSLVLDDGIVEAITIKTIKYVRQKLNFGALDIMYYSSPYFKSEIINSLGTELNRLYDLFCSKNPNFKRNNGLISFIGHSLGVVIIYDTLVAHENFFRSHSKQIKESNEIDNNDLLNEYFDCKKRIEEIETQIVKQKSNVRLKFKVENFFCLGSPLPVYLALRGIRPSSSGNIESILPKHICKHLYNIFHPSDALAYRMEPLILKHYETKTVQVIQKISELNLNFTTHSPTTESNEKKHRKIFNAIRKKIRSYRNATVSDTSKSDSSSNISIQYESELTSSNSESNLKESEQLEARIDFQLEESSFKLISILTAHTCYWKNGDTAYFITKHLLNNHENK